MRTRIRKTRPALNKGLLQSDIENNTACSYRKININTSAQYIEMVEISKTELQTSNIKIFEKCETKILKNPRRRISFFLNTVI